MIDVKTRDETQVHQMVVGRIVYFSLDVQVTEYVDKWGLVSLRKQ